MIDEHTFSPWEMVVLTVANTVTFTDDDLIPSSTYHYMIRAVSDSGRSLYYPEAGRPLVVSTLRNETPPTSPGGLVASLAGVNAVRLTWRPSTDNSSISEYLILYDQDTIATGSKDTTYVVKGVEINRAYVFSVLAADRGSNLSPPSNQAGIYTEINGLFYQHSTGAWETLEDIDWSLAEYTGVVDDFTLAGKTQDDFFNFRFDGFLHIREDGVYQFRISSDDGSRLSLDDSLLAENDGIHHLTTVTGPIQVLTSGPHRITVDFFDYIKDDSLLVEYKGPDTQDEWIKIPPVALSSNLTTSAEPKDAQEEIVSVYPNPATPEGIHIRTLPGSPADVSVADNTGRLVYRETFNVAEFQDGDIHLQTDGKIKTGLYVIIIRQNGRVVRRKVIIE
jgi:hypothetical protein